MSSALKFLIAIFLAAVFSASFGARAADLLEVRFGPGSSETRVVFDLDGGADFAVSGDNSGQGRIFIDFSELVVAREDKAFKPGKGHVLKYGFANTSQGRTRAVLELKKTAKIKEVFMIPPGNGVSKHRLVIDLQAADKSAFLSSLPAVSYPDLTSVIKKATAESAPSIAIPPAPRRKEVAIPPPSTRKIVVIDPGHGGVDPGAQGQRGTFEKTVNLAAALELERILNKRGRYKVVMTRRGDTTIRPDRREALARDAGADLFISIHADAIAQRAIRGASVYTLSEQGSARSESLARSQGNFHVYNLDLDEYDEVVSDILFDKAQDSTNTASSKFARKLVGNLTGEVPMLNRSHRTANFRVLLAPDVPAVLLEMAFISNLKDEKNLNSAAWRKKVMIAVADSIDEYFEARAEPRRVANRAGGAR